MAEVKDAKKVITLEDIKYNEDNKILAAISVFPPIGLIMFFVEKDDLFVRYYAAQYMFLNLLFFSFILMAIPCLGWMIVVVLQFAGVIAVIMGFIKALQGERFDVPFLSNLGLWAMNAL